MSKILVVGSLAYDTISTPHGRAERTLGGSANYFSLAASHYAQVRVVGVVGDDYAKEDLELLSNRGVDVAGLQTLKGKTFHWSGSYKDDMNEATTLSTDLNVFETFNPELPAAYRDSEYVFLANIDPVLQLRVLDQIKSPRFVGSDTMNFWISSKLPILKQVLKRVDVLLVNEGEGNMVANCQNAIAASAEILKLGPKAVVIKRGEYGFVLRSAEGLFILPAFPVPSVIDPTGAGDTFAGAFFGHMAKVGRGFDLATLRQACVQGCIMASFTVEDFGVAALKAVDAGKLEVRGAEFKRVIAI